MSARKRNGGAMLFETLFWSLALVSLAVGWHLVIVREWKRKLEALQSERARYTGATPWKR